MSRKDSSPTGYRAARTAMLRAACLQAAAPAWPEPDVEGEVTAKALAGWVQWLRAVWTAAEVEEALEHATPALADQVWALLADPAPPAPKVRRAVLSTARYLRRMRRPTPLGLLAGVTTATFGQRLSLRWGEHHEPVVRANAEWLSQVTAKLEALPGVVARLEVVANSSVTVRGGRLIVPNRSAGAPSGPAAEACLDYPVGMQAAMEAARCPVRMENLAAKLHTRFPGADASHIAAMLNGLVAHGALITCLHAPGTTPDALVHLLTELHRAGAGTVVEVAGLIEELGRIHDLLAPHNQQPSGPRRESESEARARRCEASKRMRSLSCGLRRHPLAIDSRLDVDAVLPAEVAAEVGRAAEALTRLSAYPVGVAAWRDYHQRFYERYGIGSLVPVLGMVSGAGIGWPDGYPGTLTPEPLPVLSERDHLLLGLAQQAALDGLEEIALDETLITALEGDEALRRPPHLEVGIRVHSRDQLTLEAGDFRLHVVKVSRGAGVLTGRFLSMLPDEARESLVADLAELPCGDQGTIAAQLSFPPMQAATAHVTRTVRALPHLISLSEHRPPDERTLTVTDLAVGCDGRRLYLAAPALGTRVEAHALHALALRHHTPPLARLLIELSRAQYAQVTMFQWGAATRLPYLPRLRYGRTVLAAAQWRLTTAELPAGALNPTWHQALATWRERRRVPDLVNLTSDDQELPLDLGNSMDRTLLHAHLLRHPHALLAEAPTPDDLGWCGARPHELIVGMRAASMPDWPRLPQPTPIRRSRRSPAQPPGLCSTLLSSLYGEHRHQDTVLSQHLPALLAELGEPPWWFVRYRDPGQHLRLRIALPTGDVFGQVAATVSAWAAELRTAGLVREVVFPTSYPETGRWGHDAAMAAAEGVFRTDSQVVLTQLRRAGAVHPLALVAANTVAFACAFADDIATGMQWLLDHIPAAAPKRPVPRPLFTEAVRVADPRHGWAALRELPGGSDLAEVWHKREQALREYRRHFPGPCTEGVNVDDVLSSLMHVHFVRARAIDFDQEAQGVYLARAAAHAWFGRIRAGGGLP
ncbi:lantibiotic dehydratase [Nonomuraea endophytica]|uniref:lantibiotic dehydratase n=1 Tax=Nonomuraea endophytica TaxID=714136 RepID=UPI0037CADB9C